MPLQRERSGAHMPLQRQREAALMSSAKGRSFAEVSKLEFGECPGKRATHSFNKIIKKLKPITRPQPQEVVKTRPKNYPATRKAPSQRAH